MKDRESPRWNEVKVHNQDDNVEEEIDDSEIQTSIRLSRGAKTRFQLNQEEGEFEGKLTKVGKASEKEKNRCWIKCASNKRFKIQSLDMKNAYFQGTKINRTVEPPADHKREGKIWLLLKNVYGTNDGVRSFFLSMNETKLGGKQVTGDKALCTFHSEKRRLMGLIGLHVDNL